MPLSPEDVAHVAWLARLEISEADQAAYAEQLSEVLDYIERLRQLDTRDVEPMTMAVDARTNVVRPDEPGSPFDQDTALANAAQVDSGHFRTLPILEEGLE